MNRKQKRNIIEKSFTEYALEEAYNYIGQAIVEPEADKELMDMLGKAKYDKLAKIIDKVEQSDRDEIDFDKMEKLDTFFPLIYGDDAVRYFKAYARALNDKKIAKEITNLLKGVKVK